MNVLELNLALDAKKSVPAVVSPVASPSRLRPHPPTPPRRRPLRLLYQRRCLRNERNGIDCATFCRVTLSLRINTPPRAFALVAAQRTLKAFG